MYEFWARQLQPRGYKIKFQIVDFPGGVPGDVGITLKWASGCAGSEFLRDPPPVLDRALVVIGILIVTRR